MKKRWIVRMRRLEIVAWRRLLFRANVSESVEHLHTYSIIVSLKLFPRSGRIEMWAMRCYQHLQPTNTAAAAVVTIVIPSMSHNPLIIYLTKSYCICTHTFSCSFLSFPLSFLLSIWRIKWMMKYRISIVTPSSEMKELRRSNQEEWKQTRICCCYRIRDGGEEKENRERERSKRNVKLLNDVLARSTISRSVNWVEAKNWFRIEKEWKRSEFWTKILPSSIDLLPLEKRPIERWGRELVNPLRRTDIC